MTRSISLIRDSYPAFPGLDTTLARALLRSVSAGDLGETFRIYSPGRVLAFGKRDATEAGFDDAAEAARSNGYVPLVRLAGGRAAVFHEHTLAFGWTVPIDNPRNGIQARFESLAELLVRAFDRVGVTAAIGEVPGEYCPGRFSVHHDQGRKIMGVGQRLAKNAAHVGGVIVIGGAEDINAVLEPVYGALGVDFDPASTGSMRDVQPSLTLTGVSEAIVTELAQLAEVMEDTLPRSIVNAGREFLPDHLVAVT
ncbi:MAG: lipoate--protein ligase family protein [Acidimicrobiia bacterium]|nr:lipoate--protein ligase family protein [Acidimicrobiia bacterium]